MALTWTWHGRWNSADSALRFACGCHTICNTLTVQSPSQVPYRCVHTGQKKAHDGTEDGGLTCATTVDAGLGGTMMVAVDFGTAAAFTFVGFACAELVGACHLCFLAVAWLMHAGSPLNVFLHCQQVTLGCFFFAIDLLLLRQVSGRRILRRMLR